MSLPDGDLKVYARGRRLLTRRGGAWRTIAAEWPRIRASLDHGIPAALGLVTVASANPLHLGHNHQALAFGYALSGSELTVRVYDPNSGQNDSVGISFHASSPPHATTFTHNLNLPRPLPASFHPPTSP